MIEASSILVVAAHPDDEVLGCGGMIARSVKEGHDVSIVILGEGMTSRYSNREDTDRLKLKELNAHCYAAGEILGVRNIHTFNLPDNQFDTVPLLEIVKILERIIETNRPDCVYTHHSCDLNIDHALTNRATMIATRPLKESPVKAVFSYEVSSSTEWAFQTTGSSFKPNFFVDISETLDLKIEAMAQYTSESRDFPHPRSEKSLRARAEMWGSVSGLKAAEAFELIRYIQ